MKTLLAILQYEFPDFNTIVIAPMALPLYYVRLEVEVLEPRELTTFQTYLLHAIALGVNTPAQLSWLLGVDEQDLAVPAGSLLQAGYLTHGPAVMEQTRDLTLTPLGKQAFETQGPLPIPKRKIGQLHFNAVTWQPIPKENMTLSVEDLRKQGLSVLPAQERRRPSLGDFTEREVNAALSDLDYFQEKEIIAMLGLKKVEPEYLAPIQLVLLEHRHSNERRLVVYRDDVQQEAESRIMQRHFDNENFTMPREASLMEEIHSYLPRSIDPTIADSTQTLLMNEKIIADLDAELEAQEERRSRSQDEQERRDLATRIAIMERQLQTKHEENEQLRQSLAKSHVTFLRTEEHRDFLEQALRDAQEEVLIISPWINSRACDNALCRLLAETVGRGVRVCIGYGYGQDRPLEAERHRQNLHQVQRDIDRYTPANTRVEWYETTGTHQKIVVCDRQYCAIGSFNWLSYRGKLDEGYRRETSSVFRDHEDVSHVAEITFEALLTSTTTTRSPL